MAEQQPKIFLVTLQQQYDAEKKKSTVSQKIYKLKEISSSVDGFGKSTNDDATVNRSFGTGGSLNDMVRETSGREKFVDRVWSKGYYRHSVNELCRQGGVDPSTLGSRPTLQQAAMACCKKKWGITDAMINGATTEDKLELKRRIPNSQLRKLAVGVCKGERPSTFLGAGRLAALATVSFIRPDGGLYQLSKFIVHHTDGIAKVITAAAQLIPAVGPAVAWLIPKLQGLNVEVIDLVLDTVNSIARKAVSFYGFRIAPMIEAIRADRRETANAKKLEAVLGEDAVKNGEADPQRLMEPYLRNGMSDNVRRGLLRFLEDQRHPEREGYLDGKIDFNKLNYQEAQGYNLGRKLLAAGALGAVLGVVGDKYLTKKSENNADNDAGERAVTDVDGSHSISTSSASAADYAGGSIGDLKQRMAQLASDAKDKCGVLAEYQDKFDEVSDAIYQEVGDALEGRGIAAVEVLQDGIQHLKATMGSLQEVAEHCGEFGERL